jgi:hypothetical protein
MDDRVECRSDWAYAQRPLAFTWQGKRFEIEEVIAEQRTPEGIHFLVRTTKDEHFELIYSEHIDQWTIQPKLSKESA